MRFCVFTFRVCRVFVSAGQVEELRRDLRIKSQELEVKNAAANDKLKKMVKDQQEAEKKKVRRRLVCDRRRRNATSRCRCARQVMSQEIQEAVYKQQEVIKDKQLRVKQDLDQVEPAVIEAQNGTIRPGRSSSARSLHAARFSCSADCTVETHRRGETLQGHVLLLHS